MDSDGTQPLTSFRTGDVWCVCNRHPTVAILPRGLRFGWGATIEGTGTVARPRYRRAGAHLAVTAENGGQHSCSSLSPRHHETARSARREGRGSNVESCSWPSASAWLGTDPVALCVARR